MCVTLKLYISFSQDQTERNRLSVYWKQVGPIMFGSFCLFIFDMCERWQMNICHLHFYIFFSCRIISSVMTRCDMITLFIFLFNQRSPAHKPFLQHLGLGCRNWTRCILFLKKTSNKNFRNVYLTQTVRAQGNVKIYCFCVHTHYHDLISCFSCIYETFFL